MPRGRFARGSASVKAGSGALQAAATHASPTQHVGYVPFRSTFPFPRRISDGFRTFGGRLCAMVRQERTMKTQRLDKGSREIADADPTGWKMSERRNRRQEEERK